MICTEKNAGWGDLGLFNWGIDSSASQIRKNDNNLTWSGQLANAEIARLNIISRIPQLSAWISSGTCHSVTDPKKLQIKLRLRIYEYDLPLKLTDSIAEENHTGLEEIEYRK